MTSGGTVTNLITLLLFFFGFPLVSVPFNPNNKPSPNSFLFAERGSELRLINHHSILLLFLVQI